MYPLGVVRHKLSTLPEEIGQQTFDDAEPLLEQGYGGMLEREAPISKDADFSLTQTRERLVQLYDAWDAPDQAAKWRKELEKLKEKL